MNSFTNNFSNNLKFLRNYYNLNQLQLGNKLGKDYSTIGKWENGTRSPTMQDTLDICSYFNIDLNDIILKDLREEVAKGMVLGKKITRSRYINYLPNNLSFLRKQKNITQLALANIFGYSDSTITNWEADRRTPDLFDLQELANIFNVSMDDLIRTDLESEFYNIKKYTKKEVKEKVTHIVSNSELEDNKKQMIINVVEVSCDE